MFLKCTSITNGTDGLVCRYDWGSDQELHINAIQTKIFLVMGLTVVKQCETTHWNYH